MHDYRVIITGSSDAVLEFFTEALVHLDTDSEPRWTSIHHWSVDSPSVTGRARSAFLDQAAADQWWSLLPGPRRPTRDGQLIVSAEPTDWELVSPVVRIGEIAGVTFRRFRASVPGVVREVEDPEPGQIEQAGPGQDPCVVHLSRVSAWRGAV